MQSDHHHHRHCTFSLINIFYPCSSFQLPMTIPPNNMVPAQDLVPQTPNSSLILSVITALGIVILILFCLMAICVIAASFVILVIYIVCECICWPLIERFDCDLELGRGLHRTRVVTYQAIIPNYLQPLENIDQIDVVLPRSMDEKRELRQKALEKLLPPVAYSGRYAAAAGGGGEGGVKVVLKSRDCAICLDDYLEGEVCRVFPVCKHMFHLSCIDRWLKNHLTCPICRKCTLEA